MKGTLICLVLAFAASCAVADQEVLFTMDDFPIQEYPYGLIDNVPDALGSDVQLRQHANWVWARAFPESIREGEEPSMRNWNGGFANYYPTNADNSDADFEGTDAEGYEFTWACDFMAEVEAQDTGGWGGYVDWGYLFSTWLDNSHHGARLFTIPKGPSGKAAIRFHTRKGGQVQSEEILEEGVWYHVEASFTDSTIIGTSEDVEGTYTPNEVAGFNIHEGTISMTVSDVDGEIWSGSDIGQYIFSAETFGPVVNGRYNVGVLSYMAMDNISIANVVGEGPSIKPGDADRNGVVDDSDLSLLLSFWQQDVTGDPDGGWGKGEFDGIAPVEDSDLSLLLANWTVAGQVPEPASALLLLAGFAGAVLRRNKR